VKKYTTVGLIPPLMQALGEAGGQATPAEVYPRVAELVGADPEPRATVGAAGEINLFERDVRWARQKAVLKGWIKTKSPRNLWELSESGKEGLRNARPGVVVTVFETDHGMALWASSQDALALIERASVNLILTSPPYPLVRKKQYGNLAVKEHIDWLLDEAKGWHEVLADDGSLVLNLGDAWTPGEPTMTLYQERLLLRLVDDLGFTLAQRFYWHNPSKMPAPAEWVTIRRVRVKPSVEPVYWLAKSAQPKASNRNVLVPYSDSMRDRLAQGGEQRARVKPSGHALKEGAFGTDNGGAIPPNLLTIPNTGSRDHYRDRCKAAGLPPHPASFPLALPEFFIKLTTDPGDLVYDPFGGRGRTAVAAETLGRRWLTSERALAYVQGAAFDFERSSRTGAA
jgi:site-specific DNA-methyltransferase (cytosine-N4-specific)